MAWTSWYRGSKCDSAPTERRRRPARVSHCLRLLLERLESRVAPATYTWTNLAGGDWDVPTNWSPNGIPSATDSAVISGLNNGASITHNSGTDAVGNLTLSQSEYTSGTGLSINGGSLTIEGSLALGAGNTITDSATLIFTAGASATFDYATDATTEILVKNGALLSVTGATFTTTGAAYETAEIYVNAGGHFEASNSSFTLTQIYLSSGCVFNPGDLSNNVFNAALFLPASDIPNLSGTGSNNQSFTNIEILAGSLTSGQTLNLNAIGTVSNANLDYVFDGAFTIQANATLNVGANVKVQIQAGQTLTDSGTLNFGTGDTVTFPYVYDDTTEIVVSNGALLTAAGTTFNAPTDTNDTAEINVNAGGHLEANNATTFTLTEVYLSSGCVFNAGDINDCAFNTTLFLPATDVQYLSGTGNNNLQFQSIEILPGSLSSGQTLNLNLIGTSSTSELQYVFPGNFTIQSGATMNVAANVTVLLEPSYTITDSGTVTFGNNATLTFVYAAYDETTQLVVTSGALLSAVGTTFSPGTATEDTNEINVNAGGHLEASNCTFTITEVYLNNGCVFNAGDLSGNLFETTLYIPFSDVQYLSGGTSNNLSFQDVDILAGTMSSGQTLTLNAIGTASTANLLYIFAGNFTVSAGATVTAAPYVNVEIAANQTLTDDGTVTFANGDSVTLAYGNSDTTELVVGNGGLLSAVGTNFTTYVYEYTVDELTVSSGGHLEASNCTFTLTEVYLSAGCVLNAGDLNGNAFNSPLYLPATDIQYLSGTGSNNLSFDAIDILAGSLSSGQTVNLDLIGTATTVNLVYIFSGAFTISAGATLNVGANVTTQVGGGQTVTDSGTVSFSAGAVLTLVYIYSTTTEFAVANGGVLNAVSTTIKSNEAGTTTELLVVNAGGELNLNNGIVSIYEATLASGSTGSVEFTSFSSKFSIDSGSTATVTENDFSNVGSQGVIATGTASATINLENNYWGTTNATTIAGLILDHNDNASRPTIQFEPVASTRPTQTAAAPTSTAYSTAVQYVTLTATVTSPSGVVNEGTTTFTLLSGATVLGTPVTGNVGAGSVSVSYAVPASTPVGAYTIQAVYNGTTNYSGSTDTSQALIIGADGATTTAANAATTFSYAAQTVNLSATVTSAGGTVNEGTETFTILNGATAVGSPVTANVSNGAASAGYVLPAATAGGTYTIKAVYNGTVDFGGATDTSHTLTVNPASVTVTASSATANYSVTAQTVGLSALVTSAAGTVAEGTVTFTLLQGSTVLGSPVTGTVGGGSASVNYTLPAGSAVGTYTIAAVYNGTADLSSATDTSHTLTVSSDTTTTSAANASITYSVAAENVTLSAIVTSSAGPVSEGTETFTVLQGANTIGSPVSANVNGGSASVSYALPPGQAVGTYVISAVYNGDANLQGSSDGTHTLTVTAPPDATVTLSLDAGSNTGAPDHPGYTRLTQPTFDVLVNQAGSITIAFDSNPAHDQQRSVTSAGTYLFTAPTLANASYTAQATFSAGLAGAAQSSLNYTVNTAPPRVTAYTPGATVNTGIAQVTVTFSELVDATSFSAAAVTLVGPNGSIAVGTPQLVSGTTYSIGFATQTTPGAYSLTIASTVTDFAGNALGAPFALGFALALPDLAVTSTTAPGSAADGTTMPVSWQVTNVSQANPTASAWHDAVYLSTKSTLDGTALRLASVAAPTGPLAPSASYTGTTTVSIPATFAAGGAYLLFVANDDDGQPEADSSHGNDVMAEPIAITAADLQVSAVSGPTTSTVGQTVDVSWTDTNAGTASATGPWVDNVYLATNAQGAQPTLLGSFVFEESLAAGASVQRTQQVNLPATAGTQYFMVTANATDTVAEGTSYGNDTTVGGTPIAIAAVPLPDLVVTSITTPPNGSFSGTTVPVSFVVTNQGNGPTTVPVWHDWVIVSQDATLAQTYQGQLNPTGPGGDQTLNNQPIVVGVENPSYLGVGASYQQTVNVTLPISAQGIWYVYVVPDGTGYHHPFAMPEASRTDKLALSTGFSVTLSPPPDLAVTAVQAPAQDFSGQPVKVSWTVANNGTGPTAASAWTDELYMSTESTLDATATPLGTFSHSGVLAVGASYTDNETVTLPVGVSGSYYFLVKTDVNGQVFENGATANNVAATPTAETVNLTPPPDLEIASITAPATAVAGQALTVSYTVTNAGAGATPNYTWNDALYLSPTATFNAATAIALGTQTHQGSLAAGASYTASVTETLPNTLAGSYYVLVDTDTGAVVFELNRTNNWGSSASAVVISLAAADLAVSAVTAPTAAVPGSAISVGWTVTNQGAVATAVETWHDSVYLDSGTTLTSNAVLLGTFEHDGVLAVGSSYTQAELVTLPIDVLGSYHLFVVTDSDQAVYETNTGNDTSTALPVALQLQVTDGQGNTQTAAVADLEVTSVTPSPITDGTVTVQWTVENVGTGPTDATYWNDDIWMSTNPTLDTGGTDVYLGTSGHTNALAPGASYTGSGTFTLPTSFTAGNYYFIVATDRPVVPSSDVGGLGAGLVYDSNLGNNQAASSATTPATPLPLPDLTVSNVTVPTTASSGGQLSVGWQVNNSGADTGAVSITDSVYLSLDQVLDPTDKYLGSVSHTGDLAGGADYTQSANLPLPSGLAGTYYVFVVTNSSKNIAESNTSNDSAFAGTPVQIELAPPADLVAGTVTIPATATAGQTITLTYQVANDGSNPANGSWTDSLYLSPTPTWTSSDPLLTQVVQTRALAAGGSYAQTVTAPLPGVAPGAYFVILRTNIRDSFPEQNLTNNLSASLTQSSIDAPALTLGTPTDGSLTQGQATYYKVVVSAGDTLQFTLTGAEATAANELYVSYGTMPTRSDYGYRFSLPFQADQQITVPTTQAGAYYVLVYGNTVPTPPESYTIEADIVPFSIQAVAPAQAGAGPVTFTVSGAQFNFGTTFTLQSGGNTLEPTRTLLQDSATAYVTFDLTNQALGSYDIVATQTDSTTTRLAGGVAVVAATPQNQVQLGLVTPDEVLVGRPGTVTVTYSNPGNTDLPAPLLLLSSPDVQFEVPGDATDLESTLQLLGFNSAGPFGTLPPGFQGSLTITFKPLDSGNGIVNNFTLATLANPAEPFDWSAVANDDVPLATSPQQWAGMVAQAAPLVGSTWGSVVSFLDDNSVQLVENTATPAEPTSLSSLENFPALLQYAVGIYGANWTSPTTPSLPVLASQGEVTLYDGNVNAAGNPVPLNASDPTFVLIPGWNGYRAAFASLAQAIAADTTCFPDGQVNVVIATWTGASAGPALDGLDTPWTAALHVDDAGNDLAGLLNTLTQQGDIAVDTTTVLGEGLGVDVGATAAMLVGGLGGAVALNPASVLTGYLPPALTTYFQQSTAYATSSLYDTQLPIAATNLALDTGDLNNPQLLSIAGVAWVTSQVQLGNCSALAADTTATDSLPASNDPVALSTPASVVVTTAQVVQIQAHDPDSMIGPRGSGTSNIVPITQPLPYTVDFENLPTAKAPAQEVTISIQLDPNLNWQSFRLTSFGFAGYTYSVPANSAYYQTTLNLVPQLGFDVEFTATVNEATGLATWTFQTVDPTTGQTPLDPTVGLLPPDTSTGLGEGFASYTIMARSSDPTGTVVSAQATVDFDTNPPLMTAPISNTLDAGTGLTSTVTTLPTYETTATFPVSWTGSDASLGSGVGTYTVYVSDNNGPYTAWLDNTPLSSAPFTGQNGHSYRFYTVAVGNDGTAQATPAGAQASTLVDTAAPVTAVSNPGVGAGYNPSHWTGTITGSATDSISGVTQERVSIEDVGTGKYWTGTGFTSSSETFVTATLANPGADSTTWSLAFAEANFPGDGTYRVHAEATNGAGLVEAPGLSAVFSIDSVPPVTTDALSGTSGNNGWYRSAVSVRLTATDATSGVAATYYTIDGGGTQTYTGSPFTVSTAGQHQLTYWSVDVAGNIESVHTDSFKIDSTSPNTTDSLSGTSGSNGWYTSGTVSVTLTASDATSGVAATYYTIDGGGTQTYTGSPFVVTGQGSHAVTYWSVDTAGNVETTHSATVKIDTAPPTTTDQLAGTLGNDDWYTTAVNVTLTAADATSGVAATYYTVDGGATQTYTGSPFTVATAGTHAITFWSVDVAGNTEAVESDRFKIDNVKPVTTDHLNGTAGANGWYFGSSVSVTLTATDANSGVLATYYTVDGGSTETYTGSAFAVSGDGVHALRFWSVDVAGNVESPETDQVRIDNRPPTTTDNLTGGWYTTPSVTVVLTATDTLSGVAATYYTVDGGSQQTCSAPFVVSGDGMHQLVYWSVAVAGNVETAHTATLKIDSIKPTTTDTVTGTLGANGWYVSSSVSVALTASDATSGVADTYYTVDGGAQQTFTGSAFTVAGAGTHQLRFWSVDVAGNVESVESATVRIDTTAPTTTDQLGGTLGLVGWYTSAAVAVTLTASDTGSGVAATYYSVDGGATQTYAGSPVNVTGDGLHDLTYWSVDVAGNTESTRSANFKIDSTAPQTTDTITGTLGSAGWYTSSVVRVTLNATDAGSGVAATYYTVDGSAARTYAGAAFTVSGDGTHHLTYWSVDAAGNTEAVETATLKLDGTAPTTSISASGTTGDSGWYTSATVQVTLTAQDASSGVAATYYTLDGGSTQTYSGPFTVMGDGLHTVTYWSVDNAGNRATPASNTIQIDSTDPVTSASLSGTLGLENWYTSATVAVTLTATDAASGVATTYYTLNGSAPLTYSGVPIVVGTQNHDQLTYWSVDVAGNVEPAQTVSFKIDSLAPHSTDQLTGTLGSSGSFIGSSVQVALTVTDAGSGVAETDYTIDGSNPQTYTSPFAVTSAGNHLLTYWSVDNAGNVEPTRSDAFTLTAPADHLAFSAPLTQVTAGGKFTLTVAAESTNGTLDPNYEGSVDLAALNSKLAGTTVIPVVDGLAQFTGLSLSTAGSYTLVASSTSDLLTATLTLPVVAAPQFKVTLAPVVAGQTNYGQPFTVTIEAELAGQPLTGYLGTVQLTSTDPQIPPQTLVFTPSDAGVQSVRLTFLTPGRQTVTVADASLPTAKGTSNAVTVTGTPPAVVDHFTITGLPATDVAGSTHTLTITAVNAGGKVVTGYTGTVTLTSTDPAFAHAAIPAFTAGNHGVIHVPATLFTTGSETVTATDSNGITGTEANIDVVSNATHLVLSPATRVAAGTQLLVNVAALTAANTIDTQFVDTLQLTTNDPRAQVDFEGSSAGLATFAVTFYTAGTHTVSVANLTRPTIKGNTPSIVVTAGAQTQLRITGLPLFTLPGLAHVTVTATDLYGNPIGSAFTDTVTVAGQTYAFRTTDHGTHTFTATLAAGTQTLTATDDTNPNVQAGSAQVTVVTATPTVTADPVASSDTALVILAPTGGAIVAITPANSAGTSVDVTVTVKGQTTASGPFTPTGHIFVYGQVGSDTLEVLPGSTGALVAIPALLFAGTGNNVLSVAGSSADNVLVGGTGADSLVGGAGRDILIGGGGPATLRAGSGEDILIGGSTVDDANLAALAALAAEWDRTDLPSAQRVHDLFGDGTGGLNGSTVLDALTVLGDNGTSQLLGNASEADWFWFMASAKSADKLTGVGAAATTTLE